MKITDIPLYIPKCCSPHIETSVKLPRTRWTNLHCNVAEKRIKSARF